MSGAEETHTAVAADASQQKRREFPGAVTVLGMVTVLVWIATFFIPAGTYQHDSDGAPTPGSFDNVDAPLGFGERVVQLLFAPVNGLYGIQDESSGFIAPDNAGELFGSVEVVLFILAMGAFIAVSFHTRALEVAVGRLASKVRARGWLLITITMVLFSLLGTTMGFSVETFGFYALFVPLLTALGYDRMTTAGMIILGSGAGVLASTVNPFAIGVAAAEADVSIGDGIVTRAVFWVLATALTAGFVLRYAARVKRDPTKSLTTEDTADAVMPENTTEHATAPTEQQERMTRVQLVTVIIIGLTFALMVYSVIPWSSIFASSSGGADYATHETAAAPYWFELNWWLPELAIMFLISTVLIGGIARVGEKRLVSLIISGAGDMVGPAVVIMLARGIAVLMTNTQTLDTVLQWMEHAVSDASAGVFAVLVALINMPLAFLIPSSSGHATLAMPLLAPLADFASVPRAMAITSFQMGHGLMLLFSPTNVVVIGGLAIAGVRYDKFLRFVWPLLILMAVLAVAVLLVVASTS